MKFILHWGGVTARLGRGSEVSRSYMEVTAETSTVIHLDFS